MSNLATLPLSLAAASVADAGASREASGDAVAESSSRCRWCRRGLEAKALAHGARFCSKVCRQTAWRLRKRSAQVERSGQSLRMAYADPPYPGLSRKYYRHEPTYRGEVDHRQLLSLLQGYDGWALSTSAKALREILPLCPPETRVCAWVKPIGVCSRSFGLHNAWEPLLVWGGRQLPPGRRDWLRAMPARGGGELPGRKPIAFCAFLFGCLGLAPGDRLDDLFPGTAVVSKAWAELSRLEERRRSAPASTALGGDVAEDVAEDLR